VATVTAPRVGRNVDDIRRALALAVERGRGWDAAILHGDLALARWLHEGPPAALAACLAGVEFCERRGIAEVAIWIAARRLSLLVASGQAEKRWPRRNRWRHEQNGRRHPDAHRGALGADPPPRRKRRAGAGARCRRAAGRCGGRDRQTAAPRHGPRRSLATPARQGRARRGDSAAQRARTDRRHARRAVLRRAAARARALRDRPEERETCRQAGRRCRAADAHSTTTRPAPARPLGRGRRTYAEAATLHAKASERWREFRDAPECAYALLGRGRCLVTHSRPEAEQPLREALEIFTALGYRPARAEAETLRQHAVAATS
jgi:hypothetical protein